MSGERGRGAWTSAWAAIALYVLAAILTPAVAANEADSRQQTEAALEGAGDVIEDWTSLSLNLTGTEWFGTGLLTGEGKSVTIIGSGGVAPVEGLPPGLERFRPRHMVWARIGLDGPVFNLAGDQYTFAADRTGELYIAVPPFGNYWATRDGTFADYAAALPPIPLDMHLTAVQWAGDPAAGLKALTRQEDDAFDLALEALQTTPRLPEGFEYLWYLGQSRVFDTLSVGEHHGIRGAVANDFGIIRKAVDIPLDSSAEISFDWLYSALPAEGPETDTAHHDYLSIAVEFDNGQDITWFWSRELEPEQTFRCPLFWWDQRETHIVLQSGTEGLGEWQSHKRNILADYMKAVGGEAPARIVGVWLIGVSIAGQTPGEAAFANAKINSTAGELYIFKGDGTNDD